MVLQPRTFLFTPGDREDRFARAAVAGADALILDLEDAVAISSKDRARENIAGFREKTQPLPLFVRINQLDTIWAMEDVRVAVISGADGIVVPKFETRLELAKVDALVASVEQSSGLEPGKVEVVPIVETPRGVLNLAEFVGASDRMHRVFFGAYDYSSAMEIPLSEDHGELDPVKALIGLHSRAAGIQAVDTAYANIENQGALVDEARRAQRLGFSAKLCIHPDQVQPIRDVFSPTPAEIAHARRVVEAFRISSGEAAVSLDGHLIDYPIAEQQERLLSRARSLGLDSDEGQEIPHA